MPQFEVDETKTDKKSDGSIYFKKVKPRQIKFEATVIEIESRVDVEERAFKSIRIQVTGKDKIEKWNCFSNAADKLKTGDTFVGLGTYFGPLKQRLEKVIKKGGENHEKRTTKES